MSARHVMSDTPRGVTRIDPSCCPWCQGHIDRDDAIEHVGHEVMHASCATEYEVAEQVYEAAYPLPNGRMEP